jgi:archaellum component FlaC
MPPEKPQKLERIEKLIEAALSTDGDGVTPEELQQAIDALMDYMASIQDTLTKRIDEGGRQAGSWSMKLNSDLSEARSQLEALVASEVAKVAARIPELPDLTPLSSRIDEVEAKIPTVPDEQTGEDIRNALEALPKGEKLAINAIENLREELDKLKKQGVGGGGGGIVGRDIVKDYDLSSQLDGVTKTFNLPAVWNIISVDTSSFPHALRKTIDYTWTPTSITFTSEIDAGSTLAAGQTVVLTIVTA